ncbi:MAG: glycosyltransferase [Gemmatimonadales bacterium]
MPDVPTETVQRERRFRLADWVAFPLLSLAALGAIAFFARAWFAAGSGAHPIITVILAGLALMLVVNQQGRWALLLPMRRPVPMTPVPGARVAVVTTFVPGVESHEMLVAALRALVGIDYPHDTWLLDEGNGPETIALCKSLGVKHFSRCDRAEYQAAEGPFRAGTKHGNYNAWLKDAGFGHYDFLAAFDPDHLPMPCYLDETLGYFRDPTIGYVQAAQAFYNQSASLVARGAAEETYAYFSAVQMAGYGLDYPIIVGSHNVHRMSVLESVGGLAAHDADDLLLTLRYRAAGWGGVYVPRILARGTTPVDWHGYLAQQRRWARSVLDLKLRHRADYATQLPVHARIMSFLHGLNFLHRSLAWVVGIMLLAWLLITSETLPLLSRAMVVPAVMLGCALGAQELYRQRFYLDWRAEQGTHWRASLLGFAKWPWFMLALFDVLAHRRIGYVVTQKSTHGQRHALFIRWNAGLAVGMSIAATVGWLQDPVPLMPLILAAIVVAMSLFLVTSGVRTPPVATLPAAWPPPSHTAVRAPARPQLVS